MTVGDIGADDGLAELLRTIADVLDIRTIFARVSEITNRLVAHDLLTMAFRERPGQMRIEAASADEFTGLRCVVDERDLASEDRFILIDNDSIATTPLIEPVDHRARELTGQFRSVLMVLTRVRGREMGLAFWSKSQRVFSRQDLPLARRITDHVALAVSHQELAELVDLAGRAERARLGPSEGAGLRAARAGQIDNRAPARRVGSGRLTPGLESRDGAGCAPIVGRSREWQTVLKHALQVARTETTVLLNGESGTGKEIVARLIHRESPRRRGPFVALNCAALPEQLLESELFGCERGAFTGAHQSRPGQIELAGGGVLFLDEVSEMSPSAQAKFLRVLQEKEFQRLGGIRLQRANVRIIAATNRDLKKAVERGDFREDLYYRLQVFDIRIAPLRERRDDILDLSDLFLAEIGRTSVRSPAGMSSEAREALTRHDWPGNVRELRNVLERAAILSEGGLIGPQHLCLQALPPPAVSTNLMRLERDVIERVMRDCEGNKSKAARRLGLSRTQLYMRLRKHDLGAGAS